MDDLRAAVLRILESFPDRSRERGAEELARLLEITSSNAISEQIEEILERPLTTQEAFRVYTLGKLIDDNGGFVGRYLDLGGEAGGAGKAGM